GSGVWIAVMVVFLLVFGGVFVAMRYGPDLLDRGKTKTTEVVKKEVEKKDTPKTIDKGADKPAINRLEQVAAALTRRDYDTALTLLNDELTSSPQNAKALQQRGHVWLVKGDFDQSLADVEAAARLSPKDPDVYYDRGLVYLERGEPDRARGDFE